MPPMEIKCIPPSQLDAAIQLIWKTFLQFEAPEYSDEGVNSFYQFLKSPETVNTLEFWGAYDKGRLEGVIATNENRKHICCFFVDPEFHRRGIGTRLWEHLKHQSAQQTITVNSSPFAVPIYRRLGFVPTASEQLADGIRYTPMQYERT